MHTDYVYVVILMSFLLTRIGSIKFCIIFYESYRDAHKIPVYFICILSSINYAILKLQTIVIFNRTRWLGG